MIMTVFDSLTGFFPLAKTLPVKLTPIGSTMDKIRENGIIETDEGLLRNYTRLKQMADEYHKQFIATVLENFKFRVHSEGKDDSLQEYAEAYDSDRTHDADNRLKFDVVRACLRLAVSKAFEAMPQFKKLDKKEFVNEILAGLAQGEDVAVVQSFSKFTSYMIPYYNSRKIYGYEEKAHTVPYRCVEDNLPIFYANTKIYTKVREKLPQEVFDDLYRQLEPYLNVNTLDEMFTLDYYNECLTQKDIEVYNSVLGGINTPDGHIKGLKEYIHLYNESCKDKKERLPELKELKKQILSDRVILSWVDAKYVDSRDMYKDLQTFHQKSYSPDVAGPLRLLLMNIHNYNSRGLFITNKDSLAQISVGTCGRWDALRNAMYADYSVRMPRKRRETPENYEKRVLKAMSDCKSLTVEEVNDLLGEYGKNVLDYFSRMGAVDQGTLQRENYFAAIDNKWTDLVPYVLRSAKADSSHKPDEAESSAIKAYLDAVKDLYNFVLPLKGCGNENGRDTLFYDQLDRLLETLEEVIPLYNRVRNFVTQKPFSVEKMKLNFSSPMLLSGWSTDNEKSHRSVILREDDKIYLAILEKGMGGLFIDESDTLQEDEPYYEKMVYNFFGDANKNLPYRCFAKCNEEAYKPSAEVLRIRQAGSYMTTSKNFRLGDLHKLIDYYKSCIMKMPVWSEVKFDWKPTEEYKTLGEFTESFVRPGYFIEFLKISAQTIERLVDEGKIYLFRMDRKDWSVYSKGRKSLHTLYMEMLFHPENLDKVVYKLSGGAEMFFRKASIRPGKPTHPAGQPIANKSPEVACQKPTSTFDYDLIKDKRYTKDMFMLHLPVAVNYCIPDSKGMKVTAAVRDLIRQGRFRHIIGIHRGERNLLYVSVTDMHGNIVEQKSLNVIEDTQDGILHTKDYNDLLQRRGEDRQQSRKDWKTIDKIRDIKQGYLSQAINVVTDMILKYEALVVLESLDDRFKRSRQKIEKNIYAKFEDQLVTKLNFLVKKDRSLNEPGGLLNGLQLTDRVDADSRLFQNGIIFYVPAAHTSNACPVTGFLNFFKFKDNDVASVKAFFGKFDTIRYNGLKDVFEFTFDYTQFTDKAEGGRTRWTVSTYGQRCAWSGSTGNRKMRMADLTEEFKQLFVSHGVDFTGNLKEAIATVEKRSFYDGLASLFTLMMQMRNVSNGVCDFFISPVEDHQGNHFVSSPENRRLPVDTDAVSAYNIARKGYLMVQSIMQTASGDKVNLGITNQRWMSHIQKTAE